MQQTPLQTQNRIDGSSTPNSHTFKEIEQFSRELCQEFANKYGDHYRQAEVIYGLTAFLTAIHHAVRQRHHQRSSTRS